MLMDFGGRKRWKLKLHAETQVAAEKKKTFDGNDT